MKSTIKRKPRLAASDLRDRRIEEILDAAVHLFAEHGYAGTDTQLLADHLQVGKGTLYRYFASKQELFLAAVDRVMRHLVQRVDAAIADVIDPLQQIAVAIRTYLAFFAQHPENVELLIQERALIKDRKTTTYFQYREAISERWLNLYRGLIADGRLRDIPVERIRDNMGNLVYGTMLTNYFTGKGQSYENQTRDILDIVFNGIFSESERKQQNKIFEVLKTLEN
ncbi:MAG TPA: TetR/AcrR family transcriptional regulator [Gemmataceae bacterium]|nr:TetR/AcrR family transcriptional regulator [Gemmataceae bacterium]